MASGTETTIQPQAGSIPFSAERERDDFHSDERGAGGILARNGIEFRAALISRIVLFNRVVATLYKAECDLFPSRSLWVALVIQPTSLASSSIVVSRIPAASGVPETEINPHKRLLVCPDIFILEITSWPM